MLLISSYYNFKFILFNNYTEASALEEEQGQTDLKFGTIFFIECIEKLKEHKVPVVLSFAIALKSEPTPYA